MRFRWFSILVALMAWRCHDGKSQTTPVVSGGAIYQAAAAAGIQYIEPSVGQAIINDRALVNWKNLTMEFISAASSAAVTGGISGLFNIGKSALGGISIGHAMYDQFGQPLLAATAPNPNAIAPVLQITGTVAPSTAACADNSMYVVPASKPRKGMFPAARSIAVSLPPGIDVTFTPQPLQVLKNISGAKIPQFQVWDVATCLAQVAINPTAAAAVAVPNLSGPYPRCWFDSTGTHYCQNMNGLIFRPDLPQGTPNVVLPAGPRGEIHINPDAAADGTIEFRAALKMANQRSAADPNNPRWLRVQALLLRELGENEVADTAEWLAARLPEKLESGSLTAGGIVVNSGR